MTRVMVVLMTLMFALPSDGSAQAAPSPGDRIRIRQVDGTVLTGTLTTWSPETIHLSVDSGRVEVPVARIEVLESRGRKSHARLGAGIGFAAGALGAVAYCSQARNEFSNEGKCVVLGSDTTPFQALLFGALGGLVGGITGYFIKTDRWEEVPLERLRLSLTPQRDGRFALGFSVRF